MPASSNDRTLPGGVVVPDRPDVMNAARSTRYRGRETLVLPLAACDSCFRPLSHHLHRPRSGHVP